MKRNLAIAAVVFWPGIAGADEISGDWCSALGAHLRIEGDTVITPGGQRTHGIYSRHAYEFILPEGEDDAGVVVRLRQLSEERVIVTFEGRDPEEWQRCQVVS